jgi:hypothetical protein
MPCIFSISLRVVAARAASENISWLMRARCAGFESWAKQGFNRGSTVSLIFVITHPFPIHALKV